MTKQNPNISIIITAYNEAPRIGAVLGVVSKMPWEIIVVDDGSADGTSGVVKKYQADQPTQLLTSLTSGVGTSLPCRQAGFTPEVCNCASHQIRLIRHEKNLGKGAAMQTGVKNASGNILVFLDADLVGLQKSHLERLVQPITVENYDMVLGYLGKGQKKATNLASRLVKSITGIRAVKKGAMGDLNFSKMGYGVDRFITNSVKKRGGKIKKIELPGLTQVMKEQKLGFAKGAKHRVKMYKEILKPKR